MEKNNGSDQDRKIIAERRKEHGFLQKDIAARLGISEKTVSKWECGNGLPEVVYMEPLCRLLGITVNELLAGESIPILELMSLIDMSRLELVRQLEFEQLRMRIYKLYDIEIETMETSENGAGGLTYFVTAGYKKYVVKYPSDNEMNHPETEIEVCELLLKKGIPACRFISNKHGRMLSTDENGRRFTVQHFYEGVTYGYNEAPEKMQKASAVLLAKIHSAMKDMENIPVGIRRGDINIVALIRYIADYMGYAPLTAYDIENAGKLFYYFLAVCNFYGQYYDSLSKNRYIYLKQAEISSRLLVWFENHIDELNEKLCELSVHAHDQKRASVFYDPAGRLKQYPRKRSLRIIALTRIADCFDKDRKYTEKEVNEIIMQNISFSDYALIRREMIQQRLIGRSSDCSEYWRES